MTFAPMGLLCFVAPLSRDLRPWLSAAAPFGAKDSSGHAGLTKEKPMSTLRTSTIPAHQRRDFLKGLFATAGIFAMDSIIRPAHAAEPAAPAQPAYTPPAGWGDHFAQFNPKLRVTKLETIMVQP